MSVVELDNHGKRGLILDVIFQGESFDYRRKDEIERDCLWVTKGHSRYTAHCIFFGINGGVVGEETLDFGEDGVVVAGLVDFRGWVP